MPGDPIFSPRDQAGVGIIPIMRSEHAVVCVQFSCTVLEVSLAVD